MPSWIFSLLCTVLKISLISDPYHCLFAQNRQICLSESQYRPIGLLHLFEPFRQRFGDIQPVLCRTVLSGLFLHLFNYPTAFLSVKVQNHIAEHFYIKWILELVILIQVFWRVAVYTGHVVEITLGLSRLFASCPLLTSETGWEKFIC